MICKGKKLIGSGFKKKTDPNTIIVANAALTALIEKRKADETSYTVGCQDVMSAQSSSSPPPQASSQSPDPVLQTGH